MTAGHPKPLPRVPSHHYTGLGDVVHALATPIAGALDAHLGTHLKACPSCARRRATLNRLLPFSHSPGHRPATHRPAPGQPHPFP